MAGFSTPGAPGVTAHTALTDKEVAGVIDHAADSVTLAKILDGIDLSSINIPAWARITKAALPAPGVLNRVQFDALNRLARDTGAAWEYLYLTGPAGSAFGDMVAYALSIMPSDFWYKLPFTFATPPLAYYLPPMGAIDLFCPINNNTLTTRMYSLMTYSQIALANELAACGESMPSDVAGRYIYMPRGAPAGTPQPQLYRYDVLTDTWASMLTINTLNAAYRFSSLNGVVWDGADSIYIMGCYDGATNKLCVKYSIAGNSYTKLADASASIIPGGGVCLVGGPTGVIYVVNGGGFAFYRYNIVGDSWTNLANVLHTQANQLGLVQDADVPDNLYFPNTSVGVTYTDRYSIAGDSWTALTGTNKPALFCGKGIYRSSPVPHILQYVQTVGTLYLYKI